MIRYLIPFQTSKNTPERDDNLTHTLARLNQQCEVYSIEQSNEPFNRARFLNQAISKCTSDTFFCLDADILIPELFTSMTEDVLTRFDIFFPVCYSMNKDGSGWWRHTGLGLVGCRKDVWIEHGLSWNESRTDWGGEDNDLYDLCKEKKLKIARFWVPGLIHQWHPNSKEYKNANAMSTSRLPRESGS